MVYKPTVTYNWGPIRRRQHDFGADDWYPGGPHLRLAQGDVGVFVKENHLHIDDTKSLSDFG